MKTPAFDKIRIENQDEDSVSFSLRMNGHQVGDNTYIIFSVSPEIKQDVIDSLPADEREYEFVKDGWDGQTCERHEMCTDEVNERMILEYIENHTDLWKVEVE